MGGCRVSATAVAELLTKIADVLGVFWRFRYYVVCAVVTLVLWDTPVLKPFQVFVVMMHEIFHALAALATGGEVLEMRTNVDESGHTLTRGGLFPLISAAGYVGSASLGALLIYVGSTPQLQRLLVLLIGATCMGMTMAFTPPGENDFYFGIFVGLILACVAIRSRRFSVAAATWLGIMLCLYSLHDFRTDLSMPRQTDAGILAHYWGQPLLAYPIALVWILLSVSLMYRAMRALVRSRR